MGKGHFGKAQGEIRTLTQGIRIAKGTADDEGNMALASQRQTIDSFGQLWAGDLLTNNIQQNHVGIIGDDGHEPRCFLLQHLLLDGRTGLLGHTLLVNRYGFQLTKGSQALSKLRNARFQIFFFNLAHASNGYFHLP